MGPAAESLILSGRNITLIAQKLHLQPDCQSHQEELVTTAQQILVDTTKIGNGEMREAEPEGFGHLLMGGGAGKKGRLLEVVGRCEGEEDGAGGGLVPDPPGRTGSGGRRGLAARPPRRPGGGAAAPGRPERARARGAPGPRPPAAALCPRAAGGRALALHAPEGLRLVARCRQLLQLRSLGRLHRPPETGRGTLEPGQECAALQAATEALSQGIRTGLPRQILDTFTDTPSPLQRLVQAALATPPGSLACEGKALPKSLQLFLADFRDQAKQMLRVAHLVLVCCSRQESGRDVEATMAGLWGLVVRVQQLFSQSPQRSGLDWSPAALQALLQAWPRASEGLLACFDDVLNIPEFLSVSIQEMTKHLGFFKWALRSGDSREFSRLVACLRGRATHIVQVMSRYVDQDRDPIFRNGLRVLIQQLEQSSLVLGVAAERCSAGHSSQDTDAFLTMAKHLIYSAQSIQEGLDGTNHPDILSPLRDQVQRLDIAKRQPYFILPCLQDSTVPEMKHQRGPGLGKIDLVTSCPPRDLLSCPWIPDTHPWSGGSPLSAISKLTLAVDSQSHQAVTSACASLQDPDAAVDAAQGALAREGPLGSERMTGLQELQTLAPSISEPARETAHCTTARTDRLLEVALQLSGRTRETRQGLLAMAGDWYPLCQQLFCNSPAADLPGNMAVLMELQQNLASVVQLAARSGPMDLGNKGSNLTGHPEALLQMQGRLEEAETCAKQLLDKILASDGLQGPKPWEESIEDGCLLWSVAVQDLLQCMERLSGRQGLFLLPLRQAMNDRQRLQGGLAQAADVSQRLQEAARLSSLLCGDEQVKGEISFLCREVHVLTDALLDVAQILASSPKPSPSLSTRFELLCLELTLRAKALTGHLSSINADYERALQDAFCPRLSVCKDPQTRPESSLERMLSGIQAVQEIVSGGQESGPCRESLLVALESILVLTKKVAQRVPVLREHPEEWGTHVLDWLQWEWAAKAHHAVAQLQAWKGGHTEAWRLLAQCLKPSDETAVMKPSDEQDPAQSRLHHGEVASGAAAVGSVDSQGAAPGDTPGSSEGTRSADPGITGTITADLGMATHIPTVVKGLSITSFISAIFSLGQQSSTPSSAPDCLAWLHAELDQPLREDNGGDSGNRITQITREMAKETKDQVITSARKIATSAQNFSKLMCIIAKNCIEQIQTMSNQLRIISGVKASLARSKSSEELLVENAQQLLHAVSKTVRAAEAASLRGLRQPSPGPEELEVAAFCVEWRRKLLRHRLQETSNLECDELGLRKTSTKGSLTLAALVQETS
ncbi:hypothetical protein HPG69_011248 [Diceros bicornis minor]|uniref:Vinculin n=1 Tax=Diceros bicornis minor TaxID=77932 RepID=A0A7J7FDH7_DICBM|nr:hypothetical protein HPG69_011248 [Diceros bicornis minor]